MLELVIVLILLAILASYIASRLNNTDAYQQDSVIEQLVSAAQLTQQLSMNDPTRVFSLDIQANQINLLAGGVPFSSAGISFPIAIDADITLSPASNITFNMAGTTAGATINVTADTTIQVCIESSGYIHRC